MLIPPSIAMVLYGLLAGVNIGKLLVAGIMPGIIVTLTIALTTYFLAKQDPRRAPLSEAVPLRLRLALLRLVGPMLVLFTAVSVSIYTGFVTPTEASALGALFAAALYFLRVKRVTSEVWGIVARATRTSCMLGIIILGAQIFSTFFALTQTTQSFVTWVGSLPVEPWVIILVLVLMYIMLGCFMDQTAILVLTTPIIAPLVGSLGFSLVWWGVIKIVTAELGLVMPPLGLNAFVVSKYSNTPVGEVFKGLVPHILTHLIAIAIMVLFPALSLWLPDRM